MAENVRCIATAGILKERIGNVIALLNMLSKHSGKLPADLGQQTLYVQGLRRLFEVLICLRTEPGL